jgi:PAS domain S-box-containing protein
MDKTQSGTKNEQQDLTGTIEVLYEISNAVTHTRDLGELYGVIRQSLGKILRVDNFCIALVDDERDALLFPFHIDEKNDVPEILNFSLKTSLTGKVIKDRSPLIFQEKEILELAVKREGSSRETLPKIWLGAPLAVKDRVMGAVVLCDYNSPTAYLDRDLVLLNSISRHLALAIERKKAEEKIKDHGNLLETILESSPIGLALLQNRRFKWVNGEMVRMFGYAVKEELQNKSVRMIYTTAEDYDYAGQTIYDGLRARGTADYEMDMAKKDGSVFPAHIRLNCSDNDDSMAWTIATFIDISQRRTAQKDAYERERLQGVLEMAGAVCHEINQPLQAILGYSELLLMGSSEDMTINNLEAIKSQASHLGKITKKLSNITHYKTVDYPGNTKIVDIWGD